jgi:PII-like signaling protein
MPLPEQSTLLRVFIGEADEVDGRPLYETIVTKAREFQMAGATVLRGPLGFGRSSLLHTAKILRLSQDLPVVIEIVDAEDKISAFISEIMVLTKRSRPRRYGLSATARTNERGYRGRRSHTLISTCRQIDRVASLLR